MSGNTKIKSGWAMVMATLEALGRHLWLWRLLVLVIALKLLLIVLLKTGMGGNPQTRGIDMHLPQEKIEQKIFTPKLSKYQHVFGSESIKISPDKTFS